jgi:hypothetical protein
LITSNAARDQLGDLGRGFRNDPDPHVLVGGLGPPVVVVADQQVLLLPRPLHELVGPGANRVLLHPLVPFLLDDLLGLHDERGEALDKNGIGPVGEEVDRGFVHDLHALDLGVIASGHQLVLGIEHAVEGGLDVPGGERATVVELDPLPQFHLPGGVVQGLPRERQAGPHLAGLDVARREVVEDVVAEDERLAQNRVGGIPGVDVRLQGIDDGVVLRLGAKRGGHEEAEQQRESEGGHTTHDGLLAA